MKAVVINLIIYKLYHILQAKLNFSFSYFSATANQFTKTHLEREIKTGPLRVRPRYRRISSLPSCQVIDEILEGLIAKKGVAGSTLENHAYLRIPDEDQHYWSPEFHVTVEKLEEGSLVRGVVGPKPKVWTMFMFFYSAVIVLFFLGTAMGVSQWMLKMDSPMLWSIPACILLWILIVVAAKFGQYKGQKQMERLWQFLDDAVDAGETKEKERVKRKGLRGKG